MAAKPRRRTPPRPAAPPVETISDPINDLAALPAAVRAMRDKIFAAAMSGDIEALRPVIEFNETPPLFARGAPLVSFAAAIAFLKARSFDGKGAETLAILRALFEQPYAKIVRGSSVTYIWPAFAAKQGPNPDPDTRIAMYRCSRFANLSLHNDIGLPLIERVGVGADGVWRYFFAG